MFSLLARHCASHMLIANSPARFSRPSFLFLTRFLQLRHDRHPPSPIPPFPPPPHYIPYLVPTFHRNAMSNAKKGTLVVPAGVCSSTASAGAHDGQTGCGYVFTIARARRPVGWHGESPRLTQWSALNVQDKEAVQTYKMEIKTHLLRLGLIRGQPRTSLSAGQSNQASSIVGTPGINGTTTSRNGSDRGSFSYPFDDPQQFEFSFPSGLPSIPGKEK